METKELPKAKLGANDIGRSTEREAETQSIDHAADGRDRVAGQPDGKAVYGASATGS